MILAYGNPCDIEDTTLGENCGVFVQSKHKTVPFSAISWVSKDWFDDDITGHKQPPSVKLS
jgi:hypothetical protein